MRKIYILFLMFVFSLSFAQTYHFDFLTKYVTTNPKNKNVYELVSYNNTDDFSYFLQLGKSESHFTAILYDYQRNLAHDFSVVECLENGEIFFKFIYENSHRMTSFNYTKNYRYEFSEVPNDSLKMVSLKIYTSKRSTKPVTEKVLTFKKANKNLIPLFRAEGLDRNYFKVNQVGNYIVSQVVEKYKAVTCETVLEDYKNVDLNIEVPQKLKF